MERGERERDETWVLVKLKGNRLYMSLYPHVISHTMIRYPSTRFSLDVCHFQTLLRETSIGALAQDILKCFDDYDHLTLGS
jgi:hypothetical protein